MVRPFAPLLLAVVSLVFGLGATAWLSSEAQAAAEQLLLEEVRGVGAAVQALSPSSLEDGATLARLRRAADLDDVSLVAGTRVLADGRGSGPHALDLLRIDAARLEAARAGTSAVSLDYEVGGLPFAVGYFPVDGERVLLVEAGSRFADVVARISRARTTALAASLAGALALFFIGLGWSRLERRSRLAESQAVFARALQRFAAMAAHEVRTPVATIRGLLELYRERQGAALDERGTRVIADVLEEVERLRKLTGDLLDVSSEQPLSTEAQPLSPLLEAAIASAHGSAPSLVVRRPDTEVRVEADALRLGQVLLNLLRNAAQARADATVTLEVRVDGAQVMLRLTDDGPGVPLAQRATLFESFTSQKTDGHGLGLVLSRRLMERMGGSLDFIPTAQGACFELRLPRAAS